MALSEANVITVSQILAQTPVYVQNQLDTLGTVFTAAKQAAVEEQIDLWKNGPGAITEHARMFPTESNKGLQTDPDKDETKIRKAIANILERPDWASSGSFLQRS